MAKEKKKAEKKPRPEKYEKSELKIHGTFDEVIKASFLGTAAEKPKDGGTVVGGG